MFDKIKVKPIVLSNQAIKIPYHSYTDTNDNKAKKNYIQIRETFVQEIEDLNIIMTKPNSHRENIVVRAIISFKYQGCYYFYSISDYKYTDSCGKIKESHIYHLGYLLSIIRIYLERKKEIKCKYGMIFKSDVADLDDEGVHSDGYIKFTRLKNKILPSTALIKKGYNHGINEEITKNLQNYNQGDLEGNFPSR
jgi:hypothetical protein